MEEVTAYCIERGNGISAQAFIDFYEARGWMLSNRTKMKDWQAAIRTWERRGQEQAEHTPAPAPKMKLVLGKGGDI